MSTEANKALVRRWAEEILSKGDLNLIDELFAADYVDHTNPPDWSPGREGHKQIVALYHTAFPDFHYTIEHKIAEHWCNNDDLGVMRQLGVIPSL